MKITFTKGINDLYLISRSNIRTNLIVVKMKPKTTKHSLEQETTKSGTKNI